MSDSHISLSTNATAETLVFSPQPVAGTPEETGSRAGFLQILQRLFSFPAAMGALLVGAVFSSSRYFRVDPDLWWHIKVGSSILATRRWPSTDIYSFTVSGQPWLAYEWLGDVLSAAVYSVAGLQGLEALLIILGSAVILALYAFTSIRSANPKAGFVASAILFCLADLSFSLRPQMLGYFFLILTLIILERFRQGTPSVLWFLPPLMLVWVNSHGSWIMEPVIVLVYWLCGLRDFRSDGVEVRRWTAEERLQLSSVFLLSLIAIPINPYGARMAVTPFEVAFSLPQTSRYIQEFQSMPFNIGAGEIFLALLLATFLAQVMLRLKWRLEDLVLFLCGTAMACLHVRFVLVFVPFFAPILVVVLARWIPNYDRSKDKFLLNAVLIVTLTVALFHYFPSRGDVEQKVAREFPVDAVAYLEQHQVPGPMFNNYGFGGYLVWSRGPKYKVFIDGRSDVYERGGLLEDYIHISRLQPGALQILQAYGVRSCLLLRDEPLATTLSVSPAWKRIYQDDLSALFVRTTADTALK